MASAAAAGGFAPPSRSRRPGSVCIVLTAGFSRLERELAEHHRGDLAGTPKALLPVAGKPMLDHWWAYLSTNRSISEVFIVSNAVKYKHFERWATSRGLDQSRVVNTGATAAHHSRGVLRDVDLGIKRARQVLGTGLDDRDMIILAGDTLFFKDFDLDRLFDFRVCKGGSLLLYYGKRTTDDPSERGMLEVNTKSSQVVAFAEKPGASERGHDFPYVSPLFYILEPSAWKQVTSYVEQESSKENPKFSFGCFLEHAIETLKLPFSGMRMPGAFFLVGAAAGYEEYLQMDTCFGKSGLGGEGEPRFVQTHAYARVGLIGNPSDGFHGKTLAITIKNFWASVEMWESERLTLLPHPLYDPSSFSGLADLHFIGRREGYYGGTRLLMATCKRFQELCTSLGIALPRKNFTARYDTNVPRQVGLAGSSAIVTSMFNALMQFFDLTAEHIPLEVQPSFILSVESELGIQAGLQDRVVQVYKGAVYMDFDADYMGKHGHGRYERLPREDFEWLCSLPLFLAYEADPSDSGKIHSDVRARWDRKEPEVLEAMQHFAELTVRAKEVIKNKDHAALCDLMDENFATRRRIYGEECLGQKNLQMIDICRKNSAAAKFPGSGGAVLGLCRPDPTVPNGGHAAASKIEKLRTALECENYVFCPIDPIMPDDV